MPAACVPETAECGGSRHFGLVRNVWKFFLSMKVLTVPSIIILTNCPEVQKNIKSLKKGAPTEYNLRERYKIPPTYNKIRNFQINLYNNIPNKIKVLPLKDFKSELNRVLFENAFYSIEEFTEFF